MGPKLSIFIYLSWLVSLGLIYNVLYGFPSLALESLKGALWSLIVVYVYVYELAVFFLSAFVGILLRLLAPACSHTYSN